jgi:hypothetical protein
MRLSTVDQTSSENVITVSLSGCIRWIHRDGGGGANIHCCRLLGQLSLAKEH